MTEAFVNNPLARAPEVAEERALSRTSLEPIRDSTARLKAAILFLPG
jgi:hypothetical protein